LAPVLAQLEKKYPLELQVIFRQLPLYDIHDKALLAAQAAEAASDQGKFWEVYDLLYGNNNQWVSLTQDDFKSWLIEQSESIGLDPVSFQEKIFSQEIIDRVQRELEQSLQIGLSTTPFLLINGEIYNGPRDYQSFETVIQLILLGKRQFLICPEMIIDPIKQYIATLHTEKGDIVIQLYVDKAPITVNSFVFLARNGWFDNNPFSLVIPGFVAQTGDPSGTGLGGPGYLFENESDGSLSFDRPGVVGMVNAGENTNGSQFFITYGPQMDLNGRYTIFGQVIEGIDVLSKLTPRDPGTDPNPPQGDLLISVTILEQ
jgi:cyclophilin family peptidyl-prolyl cis-trans isomerase